MNRILTLIFSLFIVCQTCYASELYYINNPSKGTVVDIIEKVLTQKSYIIQKQNPYYAVSKKNNSNYAVVILEEDSKGLYYYFDSNTESSLNKNILKNFKKNNFTYTQINTKMKDSFDKMAASKIFGQKITYNFNEETTNTISNTQPLPQQNVQNQQQNTYSKTQNHQEHNKSNMSAFEPETTQKNYTSSNVIHGYVGEIATGTQIPTYLQSSLNTETTQQGEQVILVLSQDIIYNNSVIAPRGSLVFGNVTKSNNAGYWHKNGQIQIDFNTLQLPSGKTYNISTERVDFQVSQDEKNYMQAAGTVARNAAGFALAAVLFTALRDSSSFGKAIAIGAGTGAAKGLIQEGVKKGVDAEIPAYTEINLILTKPLSVTIN